MWSGPYKEAMLKLGLYLSDNPEATAEEIRKKYSQLLQEAEIAALSGPGGRYSYS